MPRDPTTVFRRARAQATATRLQSIARTFGIPAAALIDRSDVPIVGIARARVTDWQWEPDDEGGYVITVPCGWYWRGAGWVEVDDLAAFNPREPDRWSLLTGDAMLLERDCVVQAVQTAAPLIVHPTPLAWLQAGCVGTVVVDWSLNPYAEFHLDSMAPGQIRCTDAAVMVEIWDRCREIGNMAPRAVTIAPKPVPHRVAA